MSISAISASVLPLAPILPPQRPKSVTYAPPEATQAPKAQSAAATSAGDGDSDGSGPGQIIDVRA